MLSGCWGVGAHGVNGGDCGNSEAELHTKQKQSSWVAGGGAEEEEARIVAKVYEWYLCR